MISPESRWGLMKHLYIVRGASLPKIFCNFCNNTMVLLLYLTHVLSVRQIIIYYAMLILNAFAMMPEKDCYC